MTCPTCGSARTDVCESSLCINGTRRRRHRCLNCGHRWTLWDGPKPPSGGGNMRRPSTTCKKRPLLAAEQVRAALINRELSNSEMARQLGCSAETVRQIRAGLVYRTLHPELLRPSAKADVPPPQVDGLSCINCGHWSNARCSFEFPDPLLEGPGFAADCDLYQARAAASRLSSRPSPARKSPVQ